MKKTIYTIIIAVLLCIGLTGCAGLGDIVDCINQSDNKITITFDAGVEDISIDPIETTKGNKVKLPTPKAKNKKFVKWVDENGVNADEDTVFNKSTKLIAVWKKSTSKKTTTKSTKKSTKKTTTTKKAKTVSITYVPFNGKKETKVTYTCKNNKITFKEKKASKDGYAFRVWETGTGTPILDGTQLDCKNLTVYAHYDSI